MTDTATVSHQPSSPFGCTSMWGPSVGIARMTDMGKHVCDRPSGHSGLCECACGDRKKASDG